MHIIIMAGGSGTRFWPASRQSMPKQYLSIIGARPLIEQTLRRVAPLVKEENVYFVINELHRELTEQIFQDRNVRILVEPVGRNTAPCIGLAAIHLRREAGNEPMVVLPADHFIADEEAFRATLQAGARLAEQGGIVTIGITPTRPETGYGYILKGAEHDADLAHPVFRLDRFVEKPDLPTAHEYLASGRYLWNSGIFIFTPRTILREIEQQLPAVYEGLMTLEPEIGLATYAARLQQVYERMPNISIDYGVMERARTPVYVLPGTFGWSDVGSWEALYELRSEERDEQDNLVDGQSLLLDTQGSFIHSSTDRLIVALGVKGILMVDTATALLIADINRSQDVRQIVETLKKRDRQSDL